LPCSSLTLRSRPGANAWRAAFPLTSWPFASGFVGQSDTLPAWSSWRIACPPTRRSQRHRYNTTVLPGSCSWTRAHVAPAGFRLRRHGGLPGRPRCRRPCAAHAAAGIGPGPPRGRRAGGHGQGAARTGNGPPDSGGVSHLRHGVGRGTL
jgi:hypothetical protein